MEHNFFPQIVSFLAIVIFIMIVVHLPASLCVVNEQYTKCNSSHKCGNITITYPFSTWKWGQANMPYYCGSHHYVFELQCRDDQILTMVMRDIGMRDVTYRVLTINDSTQTVTVAWNDYWDTYCPTTYLNTTVDSRFFDYNVFGSILMYYGCPSNITGFANQHFTCVVNKTNTVGYYFTINSTDYDFMAMGACHVYVHTPAYHSAYKTLFDSPTQENLIAALHGGFELTWKENNNLCTGCVESGGRCGTNVTSLEFSCYCPDKPHPFTCGSLGSSSLNISQKLAIGISTAVAGSIIVVLVLCFLRREDILYKSMIFRRKKTRNDLDVDAFIKDNGSLLALKQYRYSDVKKMTKSFTEKLGQGGYGCVYKGKLSNGGLVAIKVLNESKGNGEEFLNEVASISRTSHVNVVSLLGFCYESTKRALIYEFMPNGSLDQFIFVGKSSITNSQLEWKTLYQIAVGIARGLEYLHIGCNTRILHFDIKPHNILLDDKFCPKISDFGLAKLCQRNDSIISMLGARGTAGYIAPEVFSRHFGGVSYKSDVYSYGMMVLEIVGGRRNIEAGVSQISEIYFPHWIFKYLEPASTELRLNRVITEEAEEELARKMNLVGLRCIQTKPSDRPSMTKVVEMLEGSIQSIQIPPKPILSSPPRSPPKHSSTISVSESSSNIVAFRSTKQKDGLQVILSRQTDVLNMDKLGLVKCPVLVIYSPKFVLTIGKAKSTENGPKKKNQSENQNKPSESESSDAFELSVEVPEVSRNSLDGRLEMSTTSNKPEKSRMSTDHIDCWQVLKMSKNLRDNLQFVVLL